MCQSPTVPSSTQYWHMGETPTRLGNTRSRNLKGVNIGGGGGRLGYRHPALGFGLFRDPEIDLAGELRVAGVQVVVRDAQAAGQEREGELGRLQVPVALGVLEPLQAGLRGAL